ncbi:MAG TPA: DUF433 domain-containing protein [Gemmataceae bacterium]
MDKTGPTALRIPEVLAKNLQNMAPGKLGSNPPSIPRIVGAPSRYSQLRRPASWFRIQPEREGIRWPLKPLANASPIQKTPGVVGGEARIGNSRIPVWNVIQLQRHGLSDREIRVYFEKPLTEVDLEAARSYYEENRQEIDKAIRDNEAD